MMRGGEIFNTLRGFKSRASRLTFVSHIRERVWDHSCISQVDFRPSCPSGNCLRTRCARRTPEVLSWIVVSICLIKMNILLKWDDDISVSDPLTDGCSLCQTYGEAIHTFGELREWKRSFFAQLEKFSTEPLVLLLKSNYTIIKCEVRNKTRGGVRLLQNN